MTLFKRGVLLLLLAALLLPQSIAFSQVPVPEASDTELHADTFVPARAAAPSAGSTAQVAEAPRPLQAASSQQRGALEVSSVSFIQVHSPFMWGRTSIGGLGVDLTLEDSTGAVKGRPSQLFRAAPNNYVNVDRTQLYFETIFVDPNNVAHPQVMIRPGDRVRVVTSGQDIDGTPRSVQQLIPVDDLRAWTSYERDTVEGTAPPGSSIVVTKANNLLISDYVTPGSGLTYRDTTADGGGRFQVAAFRTTTDATPKQVDLDRGVTGFVRLRHSDGNEVYTVHGQNVHVLESSMLVHGYGFRLPTAPPSLESYVVAITTRPPPTVEVVHRGPTGAIKGTAIADEDPPPPMFAAWLPSTIVGGDTIEVSFNGAPPVTVATSPLTARVDLTGNQVTGSGPASSSLTVAAGRIDGYVTSQSTFRYINKQLTTDGSGAYSSGTFQCSGSSSLALHPGSFGYVGFEDARGSFIYKAFAAPSYHVMLDYPHVEGWIADAATGPAITVRDAGGGLKHQATVDPQYGYLISQKLYSNVFFQADTTAYNAAGDTVSVVHAGRNATIPVSGLTAYLDPDGDAVVGQAPAGQSLRAVPLSDRTSYRDLSAGSDGTYRAAQPFADISASSCALSSKTREFDPADSGRVYANLSTGDALFAAYGRSLHVTLNENYIELYQFVTRDLDWTTTPRRDATIALTQRTGGTATKTVAADVGRPGKTRFSLTDPAQQPIILRPGDAIRATFLEGPDGNTRPVTIDFLLPMVTGTPDIVTNTIAGVGPRGPAGHATLTGQSTAIAPPLDTTNHTAYPRTSFLRSGVAVPLVRGYAGTVSFTDTSGRRIWAAWAATAEATTNPVRIAGWPRADETAICGTAPPNLTVEVYDATVITAPVVIGQGASDGAGNFCVSVPALQNGQVLLAKANGVFSQPYVVGGAFRTLIGYAIR